MSDKPRSTEPRPDVSRETRRDKVRSGSERPDGHSEPRSLVPPLPTKPEGGFAGAPETPETDLLASIIDKSLAEQEDARNKPNREEPVDAPAAPPGGEAPPSSPGPEEKKRSTPANKRTSVYRYLLVLFGAAFVLLLLAYFIQQRNSETTISGLRDSMNLSRAELMEEIDGLKEEKAALEEQVAELSPLTDELAKLQEEYDRLEAELQTSESTREEITKRQSILGAFAILEQALRDKNYETAVKYVRKLAQDNPDLGLADLDGVLFDNQARLAEIVDLLERRGVLEPGEITLPGQGQPE